MRKIRKSKKKTGIQSLCMALTVGMLATPVMPITSYASGSGIRIAALQESAADAAVEVTLDAQTQTLKESGEITAVLCGNDSYMYEYRGDKTQDQLTTEAAAFLQSKYCVVFGKDLLAESDYAVEVKSVGGNNFEVSFVLTDSGKKKYQISDGSVVKKTVSVVYHQMDPNELPMFQYKQTINPVLFGDNTVSVDLQYIYEREDRQEQAAEAVRKACGISFGSVKIRPENYVITMQKISSDETGDVYRVSFALSVLGKEHYNVNQSAVITKDVAVSYANEKQNKVYNISYELNGGTNAAGNPADYRITDGTVKLASPTRKGYSFKGWFTEAALKNQITEITDAITGDLELFAKWSAKTYSIAFDGNGADGSMTTLTKRAYDTAYKLTANTFVKDGYEFVGWNTKADGSGTAYADGANVKNLSSSAGAVVTLYAQWKEAIKTYTVSYELDGGKNAAGNPAEYTSASGSIALADATRSGYKFAGWYTDAALKNKVTEIAAGSEGNITLYAKWTAKTYNIAFNANGGTGTMANMTKVAYGTEYKLTASTFAKDGYDFAGWNTKADGSGTAYADGAAVKSLTASSGATITLYAQWTEAVKNFSITYELNGGKNAAANPAEYTVGGGSIALADATRSGYKFAGWYTDSALKNKVTEIAAGSEGNITLYAKWTAKTYNIAFDANGGEGTMANMTKVAYGTEYKLTANAFAKSGYTFTGWNTKADGSGTAYADSAAVKSLTASSGATVTLYAQWKAAAASTSSFVVYVMNGGKNAAANPVMYNPGSSVALADGTRTGYKFAGWYTDAALKNKVTEIAASSEGNITLYAKWTAKTYNIAFNANGGEGAMTTLTKRAYDTEYVLPASTFTNGKKIFAGWNTKADGTGNGYADGAAVKSLSASSGGTATLYAQWRDAGNYMVFYMLDGGKNVAGNPVEFTAASETMTLLDATKTGYKFVGWYTDAAFKNKVTEIAAGSKGNITLYAKWTAKTYNILFDGNGAEGAMDTLTKRVYDTEYLLPANTFVMSGKTFAGWNTKADGTGTAYADGGAVMSLSASSGGKVTLYAQWK